MKHDANSKYTSVPDRYLFRLSGLTSRDWCQYILRFSTTGSGVATKTSCANMLNVSTRTFCCHTSCFHKSWKSPLPMEFPCSKRRSYIDQWRRSGESLYKRRSIIDIHCAYRGARCASTVLHMAPLASVPSTNLDEADQFAGVRSLRADSQTGGVHFSYDVHVKGLYCTPYSLNAKHIPAPRFWCHGH